MSKISVVIAELFVLAPAVVGLFVLALAALMNLV
jgi:hypothetical protein